MTNSLTSLNHIAGQLGVRVRTAPTPGDRWGIYDHKHRLVTLRPGLGSDQYVCTFAHELGHAYYGHSGHLPKNERRADAWAAQKLLTFEKLTYAARLTAITSELAAELNVLPWVVKTFVDTLNIDQTRTLLEIVRAHPI